MVTEDSVVRAWASMHFAYREMSKLLDERIRAESECSLSDVDVLNELHCTPDHRLQMLALADRLGVTRGGLTRIIDRLVDRGWVSRDRPEHNRREVYAVITDEGARVVQHARAVYIRVLRQTLGTHLDDVALDDLAAGMTTLRDAIT
ncbi:MAG: MarR family transcriptional regulator [Pseudonocardia sp.]|nr:MarR family transcriptional regulator [Pseudonocardia sp.]